MKCLLITESGKILKSQKEQGSRNETGVEGGNKIGRQDKTQEKLHLRRGFRDEKTTCE